MRIILEKSEKNLKVNIGDIILISKDNNFEELGKKLVDSNHMFFVSGIRNNKLRIHVISSNMSHVCSNYPDNVPILDWKKAGLSKASYINGNSDGYIDKNYVRYKVGSLTSRDFKSIMSTLRHRRFVNQKIENFHKF